MNIHACGLVGDSSPTELVPVSEPSELVGDSSPTEVVPVSYS